MAADVSTAVELPRNKKPAIVWLPSDGYNRVKDFWKDQYVWAPIAVDSTLPVQQTLFIDLEGKEATKELKQGETITSQVQPPSSPSSLSPSRSPTPSQHCDLEVNAGQLENQPDSEPDSEMAIVTERNTSNTSFTETGQGNVLPITEHAFASDDTLTEVAPAGTGKGFALPNSSKRRSSRTDQQLAGKCEKDLRIADDQNAPTVPPPLSSRPRRRRSRKPRSTCGTDIDSNISEEPYTANPMTRHALASDETLLETEEQADVDEPDAGASLPRRRRTRRTRTHDSLSLFKSPTRSIIEEDEEVNDSVGDLHSSSSSQAAKPSSSSNQDFQLSNIQRSNVPRRRSQRMSAPLPLQNPREERALDSPISPSPARSDSKLALRLDLNLEVEVQLKAKINGDLMLTLYD